MRLVPIENDNRLTYRIKSLAENFERIAEEHQLSGGEGATLARFRPIH